MSFETAPERLPFQQLLVSLAEWRARPDAERLQGVRSSLGMVVTAFGAEGAWIELRAPSFEPLTAGSGTLVDGPRDDDAQRTMTVPLRVGSTAFATGQVIVAGAEAARRSAAGALVLAMGHDWAMEEVRIGSQRLQAFDEATRAIAGELDLERVLQVIVDHVRPLVGARYAALSTVGADGTFDRFITSGISETQRADIGHIPIGLGLLGHVVHTRSSARVIDLAADPHRFGFPPHHPAMRTFLGVPIMVAAEAVGHLYLTDKLNTDDGFDDADQRVVETFARHAGISIERARLHQQVQELAVADERERLGRDLHDGIIQSLYAVGLSLEDVPELIDSDRDEGLTRIDRAIDELYAAIRDIRKFITGLQPEMLDSGDLGDALEILASDARIHGLDVMTDLEGADVASSIQAADIVHFVREALSNAVRHASATHVTVQADHDVDSFTLSVHDDGHGFDPAADAGAEHHGLGNLGFRARRLGGDVIIDSSPADGTTVRLVLPISVA